MSKRGTMRGEFERYAKRHYCYDVLHRAGPQNEQYYDTGVNEEWWTWQRAWRAARRAATVSEKP